MAILTKTATGTGVTAKGSTLTVAEGDNNTIEIVAQIATKESSINAATAKATPVDADELGLRDSAASFVIKKFTWANLKSVLKTYFDTLYQVAGSYASTSQTFFLGTTSIAINRASATLDLVGCTISSVLIGFRGIPQNIQSGAYTLALTDTGKSVYSTNAGAQTITIPTNASVAFVIGDAITIINNGTTAITFTTTSLTVYKAGTSAAWASGGTLAIRGMATFIKVATDTWFVSGSGLS